MSVVPGQRDASLLLRVVPALRLLLLASSAVLVVGAWAVPDALPLAYERATYYP